MSAQTNSLSSGKSNLLKLALSYIVKTHEPGPPSKFLALFMGVGGGWRGRKMFIRLINCRIGV